MKPRLWFADGLWWCALGRDATYFGRGYTPIEAYGWWIAAGRDSLVIHGCVPQHVVMQ